jgi:hypothetical protein
VSLKRHLLSRLMSQCSRLLQSMTITCICMQRKARQEPLIKILHAGIWLNSILANRQVEILKSKANLSLVWLHTSFPKTLSNSFIIMEWPSEIIGRYSKEQELTRQRDMSKL